mmetsp:Transcript_32035/g.98750  ORF Transcript_32035/g.98750 Transcript_32035/m.98750 type:complete len:92 (-) Transcript_32035:650-925(-)
MTPPRAGGDGASETYASGFFDHVSGRTSVPVEIDPHDCRGQLRISLQRIADVEAINVDLESRLETQAHEFIELESEAAESSVTACEGIMSS